MSHLPGGEMAARPLHFIFIADCSGSMKGEKIQSLNAAIQEAAPAMCMVANENPYANVLVRAIKFSTGATWYIAKPTPVAEFKWDSKSLVAGGVTDMGKALIMVAEQLKTPPMEPRGLPPVLVLISDGHATDDFSTGLKALLDEPWGKKAVRLAIHIGNRESAGEKGKVTLERFISNPEIEALYAANSAELTRYIRWASTTVLQAASTSSTPGKDFMKTLSNQPPVDVPMPTSGNNGPTTNDIW